MGECNITFREPISRKTMSHLVIDYLKYILYYRGQFPMPLEQLKQLIIREDAANSASNRVPTIDGFAVFCDDVENNIRKPPGPVSKKSLSKQRFFESISKFDEFFNELSRILETKKVLEVVLNLGPNLMNPKELYRIAMPVKCLNEDCSTDCSVLQKYKVHFFKNIVTSSIWADLKADSLLPISVLLLLENGVALEDHMEQKRFYSLPKNCKQRSLRFVECEDSSFEEDAVSNGDNSASVGTDTTAGLWVKLKPDLKGFKSYNESN